MTAPLRRIELALTQLGAEHEPPAGWQARVLAEIGAKPQRRSRPWWMYAAPGLAVAAAAAAVISLIPPPGAPAAPLVLAVQVDGRERVRGDQPEERRVGDVVHVKVSGGAHQRAVRVYRNEIHLVMRCPEDPACRVDGDLISVDFRLREVGTYLIVALGSSSPLPPLPGTYDADTAAAKASGASERYRKLIVR